MNTSGFLHTKGTAILDGDEQPIRLKGVGLGGWMNMENFITGYSANESLMRSTVRLTLGQEGYDLFFERLLTKFFDSADAELLAASGLNSIRLPINYHHFEDDAQPFVIKEEGFRHLDRVIDLCSRHGIYAIIDLHALPGAQNHHWHSDNATHIPSFWVHSHFQDRVVNLWQAIAEHYKGATWVGGYNPMNEPADESRAVIGPFYNRLVKAIREIDPNHILFLDGNTYSTEFDVFRDPWDNTVYTCHDYVAAGLGRGGPYPGYTDGRWFNRGAVEEKFLERTEYCRRTGTPVWVGEFGPIYTGEAAVDQQRSQILADQLEIYREYDAGWAIWTYKDLGTQGLAHVSESSPYLQRFGDFVKKKGRLSADCWGGNGIGDRPVTEAVQALIAREFPNFSPYPWGAPDWVRTLLLNILVAQPLTYEYAELFRGLEEDELVALADSFALENCQIREGLIEQLSKG